MDETNETIPRSRTDGDCFLVAAHLATGFQEDLELQDGDEVYVVHGLPVGRGDLNGGRRFWHAWIEVTRRVVIPDVPEAADMRRLLGESYELTFVVDRSQGRNVTMPREVYYGMGQLNDGYVWRYTPEEAIELLAVTQHYGPWVDGWEEMEEV